ncbi:TlpA family protein disulfide reductase [Maribacter sp. ANRC-HE7]|uniref:TlpA family protein disulfide reductase n=1 Tax=Maribacter aquimaris TaxID=2737171 RepID=A0ABR7UWG9_9FLAO|nr:TlpA disulfide reductase family protein [Maribacter aquimaris]MBD0776497.1 TlpA family protein disulfide reductase [Maribacter aquimaris]
MRNFILVFLVLIVCYSCENLKRTSLAEGTWRAELTVQDNEILPFSFDLKQLDGRPVIEIHNAEEIIHVDEIEILKDSLIIRMPVFEGYIAGKFTDTTITGEFIKESLNRVVPFKATQGELARFKAKQGASMNVSGIWETEFSPDTIGSYLGKGIFTQEGNKVKGTFRTTTGDYRYLEGIMDGDIMKLSAFDGAHAFLFVAKVTDSTMNGTFYSGNHFQEPFEGRRNVNFELPDADSLTFLKSGHGKFDFSFPNTKGEQISLEDVAFKNKAIIVQIMGTWCPNCLDESKFLVNYLEENPQLNVAVVALAFEYAKTEEEAFERINRLKNAIGIEYPVLLAQYGSSSKIRAQEKLPMLNHVLSYPTTIFIDKNGVVKKIHTGFNGPATGEKYDSFKKEFDAFVKQLASE